MARGCGCFAARGGKRGRKPQKCHSEIAKFLSRTAKSPRNLVQNFVKIFYSFGKGISPAALHKLGINLEEMPAALHKLGKN